MNSAFSTFGAVANSYKHWVHEFFGRASTTSENVPTYTVDPMIQDYWTMAVLDGVNTQLNVMSVPSFGLMALRNFPADGPVWSSVSDGIQFDMLNDQGIARVEAYYKVSVNPPATDFLILPRGEGRAMYSSYDYKSGFNFWYRMLEAGHYNDQIGAMFAAVMPFTEFLGVDSSADANRYNINYYTIFKPEMTANFGSLWAANEQVIRPLMYRKLNDVGQPSDVPQVSFNRWVDGATYIDQFSYPRKQEVACGATMPQPAGLHYTAEQNPGRRQHSAHLDQPHLRAVPGHGAVPHQLRPRLRQGQPGLPLGRWRSFHVAVGFHTVEVQDIDTGTRYLAYEKDGAAANSSPAIRLINQAREYLQVVENPTMCPMPHFVAF